MQPDKLVYMANQIATFFKSQPGDDGAERIAAHLRDFWDPSMRAHLCELAKQDDQVLDENVRKAVALLN
ncbi:formate dehydrogenase subunit delta [Roseinatronobacter alkalisoli]|uniref:Formate dehydrogenase subunit delta n=1 Tax=Roseinatronobacter alkalisoli TaxID=3028235 RepID=A0ABT5TAT9_9RHOB|nr:formate dehydrogenase subunit delta [Roseinatronobacter sp. HJB301]MDD7972240.1 formate dehydrogenase subunit delta [Roseinatronobacter sp. HJB301]